MNDIQDEAYSEAMDEIKRLNGSMAHHKSIMARAADALDQFHGRYYVIENCDCAVCKLTRELRKAAK